MAGNTTTRAGNQTAVVWEDSQMTSNYANASDVSASGETIDLTFGIEQAKMAGQEEVDIQAVKRISLSPMVAKRLAVALGDTVQRLEKQGSRPQSPAVSTANGAGLATRGLEPSDADTCIEDILTLFRALGGLDAEIDYEPSFKVVRGYLFDNRFLLGVNRRETGSNADGQIVSVCETVGMPPDLLELFKQTLADANQVYFGVEKDAHTLILKAYLEYRDKIEQEIGSAPVHGQSFRLFTGFKWDTSVPDRHAVSRYDWFPSLPVRDMLERLRATIGPVRHGELFGVVKSIVEQAAEKIADSDIQYLEVSEEDNPRSSFDINIYKAGLRVDDLYPYLSSALRHYGIPSDRIESVYQRTKAERFGHLAGGIDRQNNDFMTVYYGVRSVHSGQLGSATIVA